jgi:hypothetical protein
MQRMAFNPAVLVKAMTIDAALSNLRCMFPDGEAPGAALWLDSREHVRKLVRLLDGKRDCRTPPPRRPAVVLDAGTDASALVERLAADLQGLDQDLSNKNASELAYRAASACEALAAGFERSRARRVAVAASGLSALIATEIPIFAVGHNHPTLVGADAQFLRVAATRQALPWRLLSPVRPHRQSRRRCIPCGVRMPAGLAVGPGVGAKDRPVVAHVEVTPRRWRACCPVSSAAEAVPVPVKRTSPGPQRQVWVGSS